MRRFEVGKEQLEEVVKKVRDAIKTEKRPIRFVSDLVHSLKKEIVVMRKRGDSWEEIRRILSEAGVTVSRAALARHGPDILEDELAKPQKSRKSKSKSGKEGNDNPHGIKNVIERSGDLKAAELPRLGPGSFRIRPDRDDL